MGDLDARKHALEKVETQIGQLCDGLCEYVKTFDAVEEHEQVAKHHSLISRFRQQLARDKGDLDERRRLAERAASDRERCREAEQERDSCKNDCERLKRDLAITNGKLEGVQKESDEPLKELDKAKRELDEANRALEKLRLKSDENKS